MRSKSSSHLQDSHCNTHLASHDGCRFSQWRRKDPIGMPFAHHFVCRYRSKRLEANATMPEPISSEHMPQDVKHEFQQQLRTAPDERAEVMREAYVVLQLLHDHGILEIVKDAVGSAQKVMEVVTGVVESGQVVRTVHNLKILAKMVGSVEPETLEKIVAQCNQLRS